MRLTIKTIGLALLASATLVSCTIEVIPEIDTPEENPVENPSIHTIRIKADGQDTRTQIVGTSSLWSEGDRLMVYQGYEYGKDGWSGEKKLSEEGTMTNGGRQMDFQVDFYYVDPEDVTSSWNDDDEEFKFLYRAVYPAENVLDYGNYMVVTMPDVQHPTRTSFDPKADILTSRPTFLMEQPDELSLSFKRQTALGQMTLKGLPEGAELYTVVFYPFANVVKEFGMNVFNEEGDMWGDTSFENGIVMQMPGWEVPAAGSSGTTEVLTSFMTSPLFLGEGEGFAVEIVTKENGQLFGYAKVIEFEEGSGRELVFTAGDATIFAVNMSGIEPVELPDFELTFDESTVADFPYINDENDPYIEIPYMVAGEEGGSGGDNPKKVSTRASSVAAGNEVWISFEVNHPWTVSFSESWLSAFDLYSGSSYGAFQISAEMNLTGSPREATMTIASQIYGEVTVRVVQEAMVLPDFELLFSEETLEMFPELAEGRLELPFMVGGGDPKKTKAAAGDYINLFFEITHPWTVSFSDDWLSADPSSGSPSNRYEDDDVDYSGFNLYATPNYTDAPREATMTIASIVSGEINIRVVQEPLVLPTSISINAPSSVAPYSAIQVEAVLDTDNPNDYRYVNVWFEDNNVKYLDGDVPVALSPGTVTCHASYEFYDLDYSIEATPVEITVTDVPSPSDLYYLTNRDSGAYLVHNSSSIALSNLETSVATDLAFSSDRSKVYVVGSVVVTDVNQVETEEPRLWTYDCSTGVVQKTNLNMDSGKGLKVAVDGDDVYVLVKGSGGHAVLKNNTTIWSTTVEYVISDLAVENGQFYLCGNTPFKNFSNGTDPYIWKNGTLSSLEKYVPSNNRIRVYFLPKVIAVRNGVPYTVGKMPENNNEWHYYECSIMWQNSTRIYNTTLNPSIEGLCLEATDMEFFDFGADEPAMFFTGKKYVSPEASSPYTPGLYFYRPFNDYYQISIPYSGSARLDAIQICNGIPALLGLNNGSPAYWEAPWKDPISLNESGTVVDFLVK